MEKERKKVKELTEELVECKNQLEAEKKLRQELQRKSVTLKLEDNNSYRRKLNSIQSDASSGLRDSTSTANSKSFHKAFSLPDQMDKIEGEENIGREICMF